MARGRTKQPPSIRNLELYHEILCENKTQAQIAAGFGISQPRVALIRRQIAEWVESLFSSGILPEKSELSALERFHLALAVRRCQLQHAYGKYIQAFGGQENVLQLAPCLELWDAGTLAQEVIDLLPDRRFVEAAVNMALQLERFARLARQGPYGRLTEEFLHNHPPAHQPDRSAHPPAEPAIS